MIHKFSFTIYEEKIDLTTMEFIVLRLFTGNPGKVMIRNCIMKRILKLELEVFNRKIEVFICRLRQKLNDDLQNKKYFKTIWSSGYKFVGDKIKG